MAQVLNLKCANCGAGLDIGENVTQFACGFCGVSQIVERAGGIVFLKMVSDSIAKVQIGTDKTAAELAINRLKGEMTLVDARFQQVTAQRNAKLTSTSSTFFAIFIIGSAIGLCGLAKLVDTGIMLGILVVSAVILFALCEYEKRSISAKYQQRLDAILRDYKGLEEKLKQQKLIVDN